MWHFNHGQYVPRFSMSSLWRRCGLLAIIAVTATALTACGGSGSSDGNSPGMQGQACDNCGTTILSLTDAQGDFLAYSVDVSSLTLQRADGTVVETVPATTTVDFSKLVNLSEILSAKQIPGGNYTGGRITLDYTNANIIVDDGTAAGLKVTAVDDMGNPLTQVTLNIQFDNNKLIVTPGRIANLALDFNLLASNTVNTATAQVTVNPVLMASLTPAVDRQTLVRGQLQSVDVASSNYMVMVFPFAEMNHDHGQLTVATNDTTTFNIDGVTYTRAAGLMQLNNEPTGTVTLAYGTLSTADHTFTATSVLAGSSVINKKLDRIEGTVVARNGNVIMVRGARWCVPNDSVENFMRKDVAVTVGDATTVTEDGHSGSFDISDISVGQHAVFFGVASSNGSSGSSSSASSSSSSSSASSSSASSSAMGAAMAGAQNFSRHDDISRLPTVSLDATAGSARLELTSAWGMVNSTSGTTATINLQSIDGRSPASLDFTGTGADPSAYRIMMMNNSVALPDSSAVRFMGFVAPFGASAAADFYADTIISYAQTNATVFIRWGDAHGGTAMPFATLDATTMGISQDELDASIRPTVIAGPQVISLLTTAGHTTGLNLVAPDATAMNTQYAILHRGSRTINTYASFGDFESAAQTAIAVSGTTTLAVIAQGPYTSSSATLKTSDAALILSD